jgi:hypothetical protein
MDGTLSLKAAIFEEMQQREIKCIIASALMQTAAAPHF